MSCDTAQTFIKKYGIMAQKLNSAIPHVHPHLFRHTRAMHLYMAGMPLELVSQWLGHSQLETSLIYARATTDMKRKAVDKISAKENSVFKSDEKFKYADNEDVIRQLYGLMYTTAAKIERVFLPNFLLGYCGIGQFPNRKRHATMERVCGWEGEACFIRQRRPQSSAAFWTCT